MLKLKAAGRFITVHAPIQLRFTNIRIRDGSITYGTTNPTAQANPSVAPTVNPTGGGASGGNLQAGTYYCQYTDLIGTGETLPSPESLIFTVVAGNIPQVTMSAVPGGVTTRNIYITPTNGLSGTEIFYDTVDPAATTFDLQAPFVAGGQGVPVSNSTGFYAAGVTTILVAGLISVIPNNTQFTIGGDPGIYKVASHTETLGVTTSITFSPGLSQQVYSGVQITFGPNVLLIKVGDGNVTWDEKQDIVYVRNRGILDTVRKGQDEPIDVKFELVYEFLQAVSGSNTPTVEDALKKRGEAASWVTSSADPCEPYAVDIEIEYVPPCPSVEREITLFKDFRWESLGHDVKTAVISVNGKCNVIQPVTTRAA